jgi:hypothetical protein
MPVMNKPQRNMSLPPAPQPTPPEAVPARITISTTITYRGRQLLITAEGLDADRFCDLLDKRFGPLAAAPAARRRLKLPDSPAADEAVGARG